MKKTPNRIIALASLAILIAGLTVLCLFRSENKHSSGEAGSFAYPSRTATKAEQNNILALRVGTGAKGTDRLDAFVINYVDTDGEERSERISPASLADTYELVSNWSFCGAGENDKGNSRLKAHSDTGALSGKSFPESLEPYSNAVYVFQSAYPLEYVRSIALAGSSADSWICTELDLYRVSYLYPVTEYGWCSEDWYIPFTGTLLAEAELDTGGSGAKSVVFEWSADVVKIGTEEHRLNVYGAPRSVKTKRDCNGVAYYKVSRDTVAYSTVEQDYSFSVSLADTEGAGIESLYNIKTDVSLSTVLAGEGETKAQNDVKLDMVIRYLDTSGSIRSAKLPCIQSALEWSYVSMSDASRAEPLHGLFQQGEDVVFCGVLPDFGEALEAELTYTDAAEASCTAVTAVSVGHYDNTGATVENGRLKAVNMGSTISFCCASELKGICINNGQTASFILEKWNGTEELKPNAKNDRYLVTVETDTAESAGTANDICVSFTYKNLFGQLVETDAYSLRSLAGEYLGYWLSADGQKKDCAYSAGVSAGQQLCFAVELPNLYRFISATFSMNKTAAEQPENMVGAENEAAETDLWQMKAISVCGLEELGEREVILDSGTNTGAVSTNRTYYRDNTCSSRGAVSKVLSSFLLSPGQSRTVTFEDADISGDTGASGSENKAAELQNMSFRDTEQNFGFNTERAGYTVGIQVTDEPVTNADDGDCGSQNQFYFQLVFQNEDGELHTSPWVLANQQLGTDGFRTGAREQFSIYTNDDYGTPIQVNIIPDDSSSVSDSFDKLCIDSITVSKSGGAGVNMSWKADDVGWIDVEKKQADKSGDELQRSFALDEAGYNVRIEFAVETAAEYAGSAQYAGQVLADITYRDSNGVLKIMRDVDVVSKMAEYAERTGDLSDSGSDGAEESLPEFMFKKGYTNRFQVNFDDISSVSQIKLRLAAGNDCDGLIINRVSARQIFDEGTLRTNVFGEYERYYSVTPQKLAASDNIGAVTISTQDGEGESSFVFSSGNSIKIDLNIGEENVEVTAGKSEGIYDTISITAKLTDAVGIDGTVTLPVRVIYKNIYGDAYDVNSKLIYDTATQKFTSPQNEPLKTHDFGTPYRVDIIGGAYSGRGLDAVAVNQIRDREVIEQYIFVAETDTVLDSAKPVSILLSESDQTEYEKRNGLSNETQLLYLQLGDLTENTMLTATQDLQVAIVYTEKDEPNPYNRTSEYVSITDNGYVAVKSGEILSIPMRVKNVGAIKAVKLRTTDERMKINVEKGCISIEETSALSNSKVSSGWVNLPVKTGLISTEGTAMNTDGTDLTQALSSVNRITPVNISAQFSKINRSDSVAKITVAYCDANSASKTVVSEQSASEWNYGSSWTLVDSVSAIQRYTVEVYDKDDYNLAAVTLSSLDICWYSDKGTYTTTSITGETLVTEMSSLTNVLLNTSLTGTVSLSGGSKVSLEDNLLTKDRMTYEKLTITREQVYVNARLAGCPGDLVILAVRADTGANVINPVSADEKSDSVSSCFALPSNYGSENISYKIIVRSRSVPDLYSAVVNIDVAPLSALEVIYPSSAGNNPKDLVFGASYKADMLSLKRGDTLAIYARMSDATALTVDSSLGDKLFTVDTKDNIAVAGYDGTWTKYTLTIIDDTDYAAGEIKISSSKDAETFFNYRIIVKPGAG